MSDAANRYSKIDVETVRGLLLANGGGAVAMLALVPPMLDRPGYEPVAWAMLLGMLVMVLGVALAIAHNHCRRKCALAQETGSAQPAGGNRLASLGLAMPSVCLVSAVCMWLSVAAFVGAGGFVAFTGIATLSAAQAAKAPPRASPVADPKAKAKR